MILLILFMGAAPLLKWDKNSEGQIISLLKKLILPIATIIILTFLVGKSILGALGLALAAYLAVATLIAIRVKTKNFKSWKSLKPKTVGFAIAHLGVAVFAAGVVFMSVWSEDNIGRIKVGEKLNVANYSFTLSSINTGQRKNYEYLNAAIDVTKKGSPIKTLSTEQRFYPARNIVTTEAGFNFTMGPTIFTAISEGNSQDGWVLRANYHPFVTWIWLGALFMSLAGFISLFDKSYYRS
jgi:cytochrome c-type biogenesis protein CcmF